jgi:hypothetical protein
VEAGSASRQIEWLDVDELKPDPANPKAHDLDTIGNSMGRFGMLEPVVIDERTGQLLSGHGRVESLIKLRRAGEAPPEGVQVGPDGNWFTPVVTGWSSRDDDEARAALVALNRAGELGGWDDRQLLAILEPLADTDKLLGVGYAQDDLAILREAVFTDDQQTFLDDMAEGRAENPFSAPRVDDARQVWSMEGRRGETVLQFPMHKDQRAACIAALRKIMAERGVETTTDALLLTLGVPVLPGAETANPFSGEGKGKAGT